MGTVHTEFKEGVELVVHGRSFFGEQILVRWEISQLPPLKDRIARKRGIVHRGLEKRLQLREVARQCSVIRGGEFLKSFSGHVAKCLLGAISESMQRLPESG